MAEFWEGNAQSNSTPPFVVCTGGEPLLQLDQALVDALHVRGFMIAVETNGTKLPPSGIDWICVSPKAGAELLLDRGNELKLVYPQDDIDPADYKPLSFDHFFLQPMDGPSLEANTQAAIDYCKRHPKWRLSVQTHKMLGYGSSWKSTKSSLSKLPTAAACTARSQMRSPARAFVSSRDLRRCSSAATDRMGYGLRRYKSRV